MRTTSEARHVGDRAGLSRELPNRRLWVLSELYAPELTSTGYFITRIAEHLARDPARRVIALVSQPTYAARGVLAPRKECLRNVQVRRFWSPALRKDATFGRIANLLAFTVQSAWWLLFGLSAGDTVLAVTNPPPLPYIAAFIARLRGARFVLLVHDMYPEVMLAGGFASADSVVIRALSRISRWLYRSADRVIVLGRDMKRLILAKIPDRDAERVTIIPNWASLDEVGESPLTDRTTTTPFTVQHAGNMGRGHNVEILIEAAARLPEVSFAFVGEGAKRRWIEREIRERALFNIRVMGYRPRAELSESLSDCDIAAISFVRGMSGVSVPSRMYNVLASGRPIIAVCEDDSELALVVREESAGWVVPTNDVDTLVAVLCNAARSRESLSERGTNARRVAEQKYSEEVVMRQYEDLIRSVEGRA